MVPQALSWLFTGLAFALTIGRFYGRARIIKFIYWDDAAHLLGLILLLAQVSIVSSSTSIMHQLGAYNAGAITRKQVSLSFSLDLAGILVSWCCLFSIKAAFLLLYRHIFQVSKAFTRAWWVTVTIVFVTFWVVIASSLTESGSVSDFGHIGRFPLASTSLPPSYDMADTAQTNARLLQTNIARETLSSIVAS